MRRNSSLSTAMGSVVMMTMLAACGGDAETGGEGAVVEQPAATPSAPAAPAAAAPSGALPEGVTAEMVTAGQQIFTGQGLCFTCHGQNGEGTPLAPSLSDGTWINIQAPETDLHSKVMDVVRTGVPQPHEHPAPMPPMGGAQLSDEQIAQVAAYVVSLSS